MLCYEWMLARPDAYVVYSDNVVPHKRPRVPIIVYSSVLPHPEKENIVKLLMYSLGCYKDDDAVDDDARLMLLRKMLKIIDCM